jgi:hypothetical protein
MDQLSGCQNAFDLFDQFGLRLAVFDQEFLKGFNP